MQPVGRRFTVEEYDAMVPAGVLRERDRVELIEGEILETAPMDLHASAVMRLLRQFSTLGDGAVVSAQTTCGWETSPSRSRTSCCFVPATTSTPAPTPAPTTCCSSSKWATPRWTSDRRVKVALYAAAGVAEVWIVNLAARVVEVHRHPGPDGYAESFAGGCR